MTITPLGDKVLISRKMEPSQTASGLYIPDDARDPSQKAYVLAVGIDNTEVKEGDIVLTGKYAGTQIDINGKSCSIVAAEDIMGIITK